MNRCLWLLLILLSAVGAQALESGPVYVVPLKTEVSEAQFYFLRRALKTAERENASAFIIEMETYGGSVTAAIDNMDALLKSKVPTYTFVNSRALSAGALVALATGQIYMSPAAVIGAAAPVTSNGEDLPKTMSDKVISTMAAKARAACQKNGRNPDIADAFIDKQKEFKIGTEVLDGPDSLLTLSAQEAVRDVSGKPLLAAGIAGSIEEVIQKAGLKGTVVRFEPTGAEHFAIWITRFALVLLWGGIIGAYIEFKVPGFGLPGFVSIICFTLFFIGHYIAGLAGGEATVLFVIGLALVLGEVIIHPGTVVPGLLGIVLMVGSLIYAMVDHWPSQPIWPTQDMLMIPLIKLSLACVGAVLAAVFLAKYLPQTSLYQNLVLSEALPAGPAQDELAPSPLVGSLGTAQTTLRPSGKARFGDRLIDVVSRGEFIEAGSSVEIVLEEGSKVVVKVA